jgi:hypothetical protein
MSEEDNDLDYSAEETETSSEQVDSQENNTSNASESETTQKTGRTAQDRIRELAAEVKRLKSTADKTTAPQEIPQGIAADKILNAKVEFLYKAPEHLKSKADEIATYQAQYGMPMEDAIAIFDAKNRVSPADVEAANAANTEASQSRTGGTANPAARIESSDDPSKWSQEELDAEFERRLAQGEKF